MNKVKKILIGILIGAFTFSAAGCKLIQKTPEGMKKSTVAKIKVGTFKKEKITRGEIDDNPQMIMLKKQLEAKFGKDYEKNEIAKANLKEARKNLIDEIAMQKIIYNKAEELKVIDDKKLNADVDKAYNEIKKKYKTPAEFKKDLQMSGFTEDTLKDYIKIRELAPKVYDKVTKNIKISDKELKQYYDSHMNDFTEKPDRVNVSHILVKTEAEAKKVKEKLKTEDFAKVAKEMSIDKAANEHGGNLGFINYNDPNYDKTFMTAAQSLKAGEVSNPIRTQFGWHIIKCIKKEEYPIKKFDQVKSQIKQIIEDSKKQEEWKKVLDQWKKEAGIKIYEKNL